MAETEKQTIEHEIERARDGIGTGIDELDRKLRTTMNVQTFASEHVPQLMAGGAVVGFLVAFNNRGLAYLRKEKYDQAIADFSEALRLDPKFARAFFNRGIAYEKKGDTVHAAADRKRAIELDPSLEKE